MQAIAELLSRYPGRFAAELSIDLKEGPEARQRWFLAAILYGGRISGDLAARTYRVFAARGSPFGPGPAMGVAPGAGV